MPLNEPRPPLGTAASAAHGDGREQEPPAATGHTLANELDPHSFLFGGGALLTTAIFPGDSASY